MVTVTSNIVQKADKWLDEVEKQVEAAVSKAMTKTGIIGEARVKGIMEREAHDTGALLRSVTHIVKKDRDTVSLILGSSLKYAIAVEWGRRPGQWPNLDALVAWVGRKLKKEGVNTRVNVTFDQLKQLARTGGKKATEQQKAYRKHLSVLFLVGRKIATKGIRQKLIFRRIEAGLLAYFRAEVQKQLSLIR